MGRANLRGGGNFRKANARSSGKNNAASGLLNAFAHNMLPTSNSTVEGDAIALARSVLDHDHRVRAIRQRRAGHNLHAAYSRNGNGWRVASLKPTDEFSLRARMGVGG